jgi:putative transposase
VGRGVTVSLANRDRIYGASFRRRVCNIEIEEVLIAPRSPWQNLYVERFTGTIRRDLLDHVIVLSERHLTRLLTRYIPIIIGFARIARFQ